MKKKNVPYTHPSVASNEYSTKYKVCSPLPTVAQLELTDHGGMSYVVQLTDGSFIVIDGGHSDKENFNSYAFNSGILRDYLFANKAGDKPVISCWMITHFHLDHVDTASQFLIDYKDKITVKKFAYNHPGKEEHLRDIEREEYWQEAMECYPHAERHLMVTGETLSFPGCKVDVYLTESDKYPEYSRDQNCISAAWKMTFDNGRSFTVLGDCPVSRLFPLYTEGNKLYKTPETLSSDVLQVPHHGLPIGSIDEMNKNVRFYEMVSPKICLFSQYSKRFYTDERYKEEKGPDNYRLIKLVGEENCYHHTQTTVICMSDLSVKIIK